MQIESWIFDLHTPYCRRGLRSTLLYVLDPALVTYLTGIHHEEAALHGASAGTLFESLVVAEWVKTFRQAGEVPPLSFFRSSAGDEVDVVIERDGRLYGIEAKSTSTPRPEHATALARWLSLAGPQARGVVACAIDRPTALRPQVRAVPWWLK